MPGFDVKPQVQELVESADKNKDKQIDFLEMNLDKDLKVLAEKLQSFLHGNEAQQAALHSAVEEVISQYEGLESADIYEWISSDQSLSIPDADPGSRRFGKPPEVHVVQETWDHMDAEQRQLALQDAYQSMAEKKEIPLSTVQESRLGQLQTTITLMESFKSLIEKQSAESGMSGILFKLNIALDSFKIDPFQLLDKINNFLGDTDQFASEIISNPKKGMEWIFIKHMGLFGLIERVTTSTFFAIEVGEGFDMSNLDCKNEVQLNEFKTQVIKILRDTDLSGGHFQIAQQMAVETLQSEFDQVMKNNFKTRQESVRIGNRKVKMEVIGDLYDESVQKLDKKCPKDEWRQEIKKENPDLSAAEIDQRIKNYVESLAYQDYQHAAREAIGEVIYNKDLFESWSKDKQAVWDQFTDSMGYGATDLADESWDTIFTEFVINAPLILVSGGFANAARAAASKGLSFGARAVIGGAKMTQIAARAGRYGRFGGRLSAGTAGLAFEGMVFEMTNAGFRGEWLFNSPDWAQRIMWSSAALGMFKGAGKLGEKLVGKEGVLKASMGKITNPYVRKGAESMAKGHLEVAAMLTLGAIQNGAYNGNLDDFFDNFGEELFHSYVAIGALKVSAKGVQTMKGRWIEVREAKAKTKIEKKVAKNSKEQLADRDQISKRNQVHEGEPNPEQLPLAEKLKAVDQINSKNQQEMIDRIAESLTESERILFAETYLDPLTGMLNRQGLNLLDSMLATGKKVSVLSYDGDHFKALNEGTSVENGDYIIKVMGAEFHQMVRELSQKGYETEAVRMGGEEFIVFSTAPKIVMAEAMKQMSARLKNSIRENLTPDQMNAMVRMISESKYQNDSNGLQRAYGEIGGSTAGISEIQLSPEHLSEGSATRLRENALQYVDSFLEHGKKGGRGKVYLDERTLERSTTEVVEFNSENSLTDSFNKHLSSINSKLKGAVSQQFTEHTQKAQDLLRDHPDHQVSLEGFFANPKVSEAQVNLIVRETGIPREYLLGAKQQYMEAIRDFGTYTGASTMRRLTRLVNEEGSGYREIRTIELGEFKSINEIMGHTYGDAFLTYAYQSVILPTVRIAGLEGRVIIAQKGANFKISFHESVTPSERAAFEQLLVEGYEVGVQNLFKSIDTGEVGPVQAIREQWLQENKTSTLQQSLADQYRLRFEAVLAAAD